LSQSVVFSTWSRSTNTNLPEFIYLDTNSVLDIGLNRRHKNALMSFIGYASKNDTIFIYSPHMLEELKHTVHVAILEEEARKINFSDDGSGKPLWKQLENSGFNAGPLTLKKHEDIMHILKTASSENLMEIDNPPNKELEAHTNEYMKIGIAPKDAKHAAIMNCFHVNNILTKDAGFIKVPDINIYAPNSHILKHQIVGAPPVPYASIIPKDRQEKTS
jgi:hypothetical protein